MGWRRLTIFNESLKYSLVPSMKMLLSSSNLKDEIIEAMIIGANA